MNISMQMCKYTSEDLGQTSTYRSRFKYFHLHSYGDITIRFNEIESLSILQVFHRSRIFRCFKDVVNVTATQQETKGRSPALILQQQNHKPMHPWVAKKPWFASSTLSMKLCKTFIVRTTPMIICRLIQWGSQFFF